ncbi:hypothetical protein BGZ52_001590 [Haplosporangium bisporale]|uniref:PI31 proteasome regulator C-terminal domain-containing protein n=1 Tax=Podila verticillata NRRL 6337 TaxID=1069443 RepID=A0A086TJV5_9FUNG|nr:hypothetical protein BGZ52_001590 [Haplosporangium bisporale]KAF9213757.1 hypothetical protein BGZ59_004908 [Podila verticillata]KAI9235888.1 MAG: hypothetical protein BYD32DRAFT_419991 [Podila humilis]KFH62232.1 hypothetical protein MVEG_11870 [Podila verticillata NRRL 6337]
MSFNLGNNDRQPNFTAGSATGANNRNPLAQATNPGANRGADMVLTPDHPSWHAHHGADPASAQNPHSYHPTGSGPSGQPGFHHDPNAPYSGGRANTTNTGPFRAGPDRDSYLPPGAVPQGARFDPIMPENGRQGLPDTGNPYQQGQGQRQGHFTSGEPDYDEMLPPR